MLRAAPLVVLCLVRANFVIVRSHVHYSVPSLFDGWLSVFWSRGHFCWSAHSLCFEAPQAVCVCVCALITDKRAASELPMAGSVLLARVRRCLCAWVSQFLLSCRAARIVKSIICDGEGE